MNSDSQDNVTGWGEAFRENKCVLACMATARGLGCAFVNRQALRGASDHHIDTANVLDSIAAGAFWWRPAFT
jgi:hypothetical protein